MCGDILRATAGSEYKTDCLCRSVKTSDITPTPVATPKSSTDCYMSPMQSRTEARLNAF